MQHSVVFQAASGRRKLAPFLTNNFNQQEEVMEKKLLTVAIGTALMAGASLAQAAVTVGGMAQVEYYNGTAECSVGTGTGNGVFPGSGMCTATNAAKHKASGLVDNSRGRVVIHADEEIGSIKALAHYEFSVDTANSGQAVGAGGNTGAYYDGTTPRSFDQRSREKYVGLQGGFGTLTLGNLHGVYKRLAGTRWDPFNATVLEARGNGGQSGSPDVSAQFAHSGFIPGAVKWESDKLMGDVFRLEVLVAPDSSRTVGADAGNGYDYQIGFSVKPIKALEIIAAYSNNKEQQSATARDDATSAKLGARFGFGANTLWLQYEKVDIDAGTGVFNLDGTAGSTHDANGVTTVNGSPADASYLWLGYSLAIGSNQFVAQVAKHEREQSGQIGVEAMYFNLGYIHNFSKTAKVWIGGRKTAAEQGTVSRDTTVFSTGLRKDF